MTMIKFENIKSSEHLYIDDNGMLVGGVVYYDIELDIDPSQVMIYRETVNAIAQYIKSIYIFNGYSKCDSVVNVDDNSFVYSNVSSANFNLKCDDGIINIQKATTYNDGMVEVFKEYFDLSEDDTSVLKSVKCTNKFTKHNTISFMNLVYINEFNNITPNVVYFSILERDEDYDSRCEVCEKALKSLSESLATLNKCIFYNKDTITQSKNGCVTFKQKSYNVYPLEFKIYTENCPKFELEETPSIYSIGKIINSNFIHLLNLSKIKRFSLYDSYGVSVEFDVEKLSDDALF